MGFVFMTTFMGILAGMYNELRTNQVGRAEGALKAGTAEDPAAGLRAEPGEGARGRRPP